MRTIIFSDVDQCLVDHKPSSPKDKVIAYKDDGQPDTYQSAKQERLLNRLKRRGRLIPTTGRRVDDLQKLALPFKDWSICSFGGVILDPDGNPDAVWHELIEAQARRYRDEFETLIERAESEANYKPLVITDNGVNLFLNFDHIGGDLPEDERADGEKLRSLVPQGWRLRLNGIGHDGCAQPPYIGKDKAVAWFLKNRAKRAELVLGVGDSFMDTEFLGLCDFAVVPTDSQLFRTISR